MFGVAKNWMTPSANPIGIDLGSSCVRLAQVRWIEDEYRIIAAASGDVTTEPSERLLGDLLNRGKFHGRSAVLALPSSIAFTNQTTFESSITDDDIVARLPELLPESLRDGAIIRPLVLRKAGQPTRVIFTAACRERVQSVIGLCESAGVKLVGMTTSSQATADCFAHVYRRASDLNRTLCFVDIGHTGTRILLVRGQMMLAACDVQVGGAVLCDTLATDNSLSFKEAIRRRNRSASDEQRRARQTTHVLFDPSTMEAPLRIGPATSAAIDRIVEGIRSVASHTVDALTFIGGEARQRSICTLIAKSTGVLGQIGDPLVRFGHTCAAGVESGIDRREPQPAWAIALGLSLGPTLPAATVTLRRTGSTAMNAPFTKDNQETEQ